MSEINPIIKEYHTITPIAIEAMSYVYSRKSQVQKGIAMYKNDESMNFFTEGLEEELIKINDLINRYEEFITREENIE